MINGFGTASLLSFALFLMSCGGVTIPKDVADETANLPDKIDYNIHVKKILSDKCFACHGPDAKKQKANLRLDIDTAAYNKKTESGLRAIKPSSLSNSELVHRILSEDADYKMPTPASHLSLTAYEKAVILKWIEQGAVYKKHWAFVAPEKNSAPSVVNKDWAKNDIDLFILNKIENEKLNPAKLADKETLIRRLSFDIRGISPSLSEIEAFNNSTDPKAYEKLVDNFLSSKHYGERMSAYWLDLARFADSYGYLDDKHYDMSPWREWLINAYNKNLPFNDFITWQMAGDLLPNSTQEQILATGFNRNHKQNTEAGIIDEEFRIEYVVDRTNTLGTGIMAMTVGCAKCHDHKYDPISQKDYYSLSAFFNSTFEKGSPNYGNTDMVAGPTLLLTKKEEAAKINQLQQYIRQLELEQKVANEKSNQQSTNDLSVKESLGKKVIAKLSFDKLLNQGENATYFANEADNKNNAKYKSIQSGKGVLGNSLKYTDETFVSFPPYTFAYFERYQPFSFSLWLKVPTKYPLATVFYQSDYHKYGYQGYDLLLKDNKLNFRLVHAFPHDAISVFSNLVLDTSKWYHVAISYDGSSSAAGVAIYVDGKKINTTVEYDHLKKHIRSYPSIHKAPLSGLDFGVRTLDRSMPGGEIDEFQLFNEVLTQNEVTYLHSLQAYPISSKKNKLSPISTPLLNARIELCNLYDSIKEVMVMGDLPQPRPTYVLKRGVYDNHGDQVFPSTPNSILPFAADLPKNRLGLAKWLFSEKNPLTSRVAVNRIWELIFGKGIVKSSDNFGNQGEMPSHPELLDYLAVWYRENGWNTKALQKLIFMSATYQQSSINEPAIIKKDPQNILLTRSPRYRLPAEMIRDNALFISNLLSSKIGGPSVYPYQPAGLWEELSDKKWRYQYLQENGEGLYRKSIYTIRKRTSVVPFLQIFDGTDRSVCTVKRQNSSSPMQSLALLNDPQMIEAARLIGWRMMQEGGATTAKQLAFGFKLVTGRNPTTKELNLLENMFTTEQNNYKKNPDKAVKILSVGATKVATNQTLLLATNASVALALMNTDEFITRH